MKMHMSACNTEALWPIQVVKSSGLDYFQVKYCPLYYFIFPTEYYFIIFIVMCVIWVAKTS